MMKSETKHCKFNLIPSLNIEVIDVPFFIVFVPDTFKTVSL